MPVLFTIDETTYNRTRTHAIRDGYEVRSAPPTSIVIHTTNGPIGSSFSSEASYLQDSPDVSTHYLIGKDGRIALIVPPDFAAWHSGVALAPFTNDRSVGIELHHSVSDPWTAVQFDALTWLTRRLIAQYRIDPIMVETHRHAAQPPGRKSDPSDWSDANFYAWRAALDPWHAWGTDYPLPVDQRGWGIPQCWLRNAWLGEARSFEVYADEWTSIQTFESGFIVYEKQTGNATAYHRGKDVP